MRSFRFTISGLMGIVVAVSVGLAALRSSSMTWAGVTFLMAVWVLSLGVVGVACGRQSERAWWLGFSLFGWGYLSLAFYHSFFPDAYGLPNPRTMELLYPLRSYIDALPRPGYGEDFYSEVGHSLLSLVAAALGGLLSHAFFGEPAVPPALPIADRQEVVRAPRRWWRRHEVLGLVGLLLYTSAALFGVRKAPGLWAGVTVLLTWGLLGLTAIAAVSGRGRRRVIFLGATLFGAGYLVLVSSHLRDSETWAQSATYRLLESLRPWLPTVVKELPGKSDGIAYANARVFVALDQRISMPFREETPLEDVLRYIRAATRGPDGRNILIHVDPVELMEAEKTMQSPVRLDLGRPVENNLAPPLETTRDGFCRPGRGDHDQIRTKRPGRPYFVLRRPLPCHRALRSGLARGVSRRRAGSDRLRPQGRATRLNAEGSNRRPARLVRAANACE